MRISPAYIEQNAELLRTTKYGGGGYRIEPMVRKVAKQYGALSILDYGAGKGALSEAAPDLNIQSYDPCNPMFHMEPEPADLVVCRDVMEHVEPECIDSVVEHLSWLTKKALLLVIVHGSSNEFLPDGRNTHLSVMPFNDWRKIFSQWFRLDFVKGPTPKTMRTTTTVWIPH